MDLKKLEVGINYTFTNNDYLNEAITHRSYLNEHHGWEHPHNERLEFLGDAVLELAVTEELFNRYPSQAEGWMTSVRAALVNYIILAQIAKEIHLEEFLLMSKGERKDSGRGRDVILANAMESLIGAIHLDGGFSKSKKFINQFILSHLEEVLSKSLYIDAKSQLQEKVQASLKVTPHYQTIEENGPDHEKTFTIGVYFGEKLIATGKGLAKQDAEVEAAKEALKIVEK